MKTIEIMIGGQKAQFTTKSVALDGKEYSYAKMSQVHHDAENHLYSFVYEGEAKEFHYEEKSAKVLAAIFSQVQKMDEMRKAKAEEKVPAAPVAEVPVEETPAEVPTEAPTVEPEAPAKPEPAVEPEAQEETKASENAATYDEMDEMIKATIAINEERAKKEEEKAKKKARKKAIKEAKKNGTPLPEEEKKENGNEDGSGDAPSVDPEKQAKLKKSLKIFAIIVAIVLAASLIYFFIFGTSHAPTDNAPVKTENQQYDDIDDLIEDLQ